MKRTKLSIYTALCLLSGLAVASCGSKEETATAEELPIVAVGYAQRMDVAQTKEYTANVEAENINNITPQAPNRIKKLHVDVGDKVRAGQVLAEMDLANVEQLRINMDQVEREYQRAQKLLEIGAGTRQTVDQLEAQLSGLKTQYRNLQENTILRSPISGVVTARNYDAGDMTGQLPIFTVGQLAPVVKVMINVSENDMTSLRNGQPVAVTLDAFPGETFSGKINRIYPTVDAATRTFPVEVRIANSDSRIKPGSFARVTVDLGSKSNVVVPDRAVVKQTGSGNKYVYVLHGDKVSYEKVELGQRLDNAYELLSGINDGDTVVVSGQIRLNDGAKVVVE